MFSPLTQAATQKTNPAPRQPVANFASRLHDATRMLNSDVTAVLASPAHYPQPLPPPIRPRVPLTRFRRMQGLAPRGYGWQHGDRGKPGTPSAAPGVLPYCPAVLTAGFQPPVAAARAASGIKEGAGRQRVGQREAGGTEAATEDLTCQYRPTASSCCLWGVSQDLILFINIEVDFFFFFFCLKINFLKVGCPSGEQKWDGRSSGLLLCVWRV